MGFSLNSISVFKIFLLALALFFFVESALCDHAKFDELRLNRNKAMIQNSAKKLLIPAHSSASSSRAVGSSSSSSSSSFESMVKPLAVPDMNCPQTLFCTTLGDECQNSLSNCQTEDGTGCCALGLWCLNSKGSNSSMTCQTDTLGKSCNMTYDCYGNAFGTGLADCINGTCTEILNTGDYCQQDAECLSFNCMNGRCQGTPDGESCDTNLLNYGQACRYGSYCSLTTGLCTPTVQDFAGSCYNSLCAPGLSCVNEAICYPMFSRGILNGCDKVLDCDVESNLDCDMIVSKSCTTNNYKSQTSCTSNCFSGYCLCSQISGNSFCYQSLTSSDCNIKTMNLYTCMTNNNCSYSTSPSIAQWGPNNAPNGCTMKNCAEEYKAQAKCQCQATSLLYGGCFYNPACHGLSVGVIVGIVVAAIVVVVIVVVILVVAIRTYLLRRKRLSFTRL